MTDYSNLTDALRTYMQAIGKMVFDRSQELVPVKTGRLKESGSYTFTGESATINYNTPYAHRINFGGGVSVADAATTYKVRRHQRRVPSKGTVVVKEHMKRIGQRQQVVARTRQGFLSQAVDEVLGDAGALKRAWLKAHGDAEPSIKAPRIM